MLNHVSRRPLGRFALLCGLAAVASGLPARAFSEKDEVALGKKTTPGIIRMLGGVLPDANPMALRVRRIGMSMAQFSGRKTIHFSYHVLNNDSMINAFAAPGGDIFISRALVKMTSNDAELAYILGHETGHIDRRHLAQMMEEHDRVHRIATSIGNTVFGKGKDQSTLQDIADITFLFQELSYSREHELEADLIGVRWMSKLGYDPRSAIKILDKMRVRSGDAGPLAQYFSTHPMPEVREEAIQDAINDEKLLDVARQAGGPRLWWTAAVPHAAIKAKATVTPAISILAPSSAPPASPSTPAKSAPAVQGPSIQGPAAPAAAATPSVAIPTAVGVPAPNGTTTDPAPRVIEVD